MRRSWFTGKDSDITFQRSSTPKASMGPLSRWPLGGGGRDPVRPCPVSSFSPPPLRSRPVRHHAAKDFQYGFRPAGRSNPPCDPHPFEASQTRIRPSLLTDSNGEVNTQKEGEVIGGIAKADRPDGAEPSFDKGPRGGGRPFPCHSLWPGGVISPPPPRRCRGPEAFGEARWTRRPHPR